MFKAATKKTNKRNNTRLFQNNEKVRQTFFQPKLNVGTPGDRYEVEADKVADQVVDHSPMTEQSFFVPSVSPPGNSGQPFPVQHKPVADSITPLLQKQDEEEEMMLRQPVEEEEMVQSQVEEDEMVQQQHDEGNEPVKAEAVGNEPLQQQTETANQTLANQTFSAIQKQEMEEEEPAEIQASEDEELMPVMAEKEGQIQTKADVAPAIPSGFESGLNGSKGSGSPLPSGVKNQMETGFGADFSNVHIHTDSNAAQMSRQIGAQAFTHGSDIYFNEGKFNPASQSGQHLIAHELTHTVQQGASVQPKRIQRQDEEEVAEIDPPQGVTPISDAGGEFSFSEGNYTTAFESPPSNELRLPVVSVSDFKSRNSGLFNPPFQVPVGRDTNQVANWETAINDPATRHLNNKIGEATASGGFSRTQNEGDRVYFFKGKQNPEFRIFGGREQLFELAKIPIWDEQNNPTSFQVDHIVEHQLGGSDDVNNYELLEASANGSSGSSIAWEMNKRIKHAYDILNAPYYQHAGRTEKPNLPPRPGRANQYVNTFLNRGISISFLSNDFDLTTKSGMPDRFWSFNQVSQGEHFNKIEPLTGDEMRELGTEDDPALFVSPTGGNRLTIPEGDAYPVNNWLPRVDLLSRPDFDNLTLQVDAYRAKDTRRAQVTASYPNMTWHLNRLPDTYIFYVNKEQTIQNALTGSSGVFQSLRLPGMSPIRFDSLEITESGFQGMGKVLPDVPLIADADIDIVIDGDGVRLRKLFTAQEFNFPPPFEVNEATLEVSFGTDGLGIEGRVDFGIENVGEGHIGAAASTSGGFELEGAFNFDSELFDPAEINVEYKENVWTIGGTIGIPEGKVRGIKNATITASYSENTFTASGEAELDVPGIERGTMEVIYGEEGFSISGDFDLKDDIPGIRGGNVSATIARQTGEEGYSVRVSGTAQPDIPGVDSTLTVTYDNGALTIEGSAAYSRGMLAGTVNIGATNRPIGDNGQPAGDPDGTMRVYGGGSLTLTLTPWLQATAGVQFLPNGEIEVTGRIGLPGTVDVFDRKSIDRNLFTAPAIEIPIFAIPLGPRSIGLVARITGGLDFSAGFGPGQLRNLYAEVTYNPDREEETTITGHGEFAIPADAGLTLRGDLGLGVSVGIASLTGGIEIAGTLGLEGEAAAEVDVNWSPQTGLALDATGRITVNPKFTFDVNAFARASLDLWITSISETWRYNLVSFSWGPDIQFGIVFPVHYREGEPFDMSFDDIQVIYPDLDIIEMAKGLARDIKDRIFD